MRNETQNIPIDHNQGARVYILFNKSVVFALTTIEGTSIMNDAVPPAVQNFIYFSRPTSHLSSPISLSKIPLPSVLRVGDGVEDVVASFVNI